MIVLEFLDYYIIDFMDRSERAVCKFMKINLLTNKIHEIVEVILYRTHTIQMFKLYDIRYYAITYYPRLIN